MTYMYLLFVTVKQNDIYACLPCQMCTVVVRNGLDESEMPIEICIASHLCLKSTVAGIHCRLNLDFDQLDTPALSTDGKISAWWALCRHID